MTLPLYNKPSHPWHTQLISPGSRLRHIMLGILLALVFGVLCSMLLMAERAGTNLVQRLKRHEIPPEDSFVPEVETLKTASKSLSTTATSTRNGPGLNADVDLLGGFTGLETHFYVAHMSTLAATTSPFPTPSISAMDPLRALSEALREAIDGAQISNMTSSISGDQLPTKKETRRNNKAALDSILWQGQPSLLHMVSDIAGQVCALDSGAGARLIDTIVNILSLDSFEIASVISRVAEYSSSSPANMLPLLIPAIAAALGEHIDPSHVSNTQNIDGTMAEVLWKGDIFLTTIITSKAYLDNTELHDIVNQVAGLMCAAANRLRLPICMISTEIASQLYQLVIPCGCITSKQAPSASQPPQGYNPAAAVTTTLDWSVLTVPPTAGYTFQSFSTSNVPSGYERYRASNFPVTTLRDYVPAPAIQPYAEPAKPQTSYSSCPPPAYSVTTRMATEVTAPSAYAEPPVAPSSSSVCSCQERIPMGYPSSDNYKPTKEETIIPESYDYDANASTKPPSPATECYSEPVTQIVGVTRTTTNPPQYSQPSELPSQQPIEYNPKNPTSGKYSLAQAGIDWKYLGCFGDAPERTFQGGGPDSSFRGKVSNLKCIDYCKSKDFELAGTEDGQECWCGKSMTENVRRLPEAACSTICLGESADYCGGTWAISVYTRERKERDQPRNKYSSLAELLSLGQ